MVLIQLATVLQRMALGDSPAEGFTFLATVMACHLGLARLSAASQVVRRVLRGEPRVLVRDGQILQDALESERMSRDDLLAGLRKQGYASPEDVKLAVLEETGHVSAVPRDDPGPHADLATCRSARWLTDSLPAGRRPSWRIGGSPQA